MKKIILVLMLAARCYAMDHPLVSGDQSVARDLMSNRKIALILIGDSKTSDWGRQAMRYMSHVPWGGCAFIYNFRLSAAGNWADSTVTATSGDVTWTSRVLSPSKANTWTPLASYEQLMIGGTASTSIFSSRLFSSTYYNRGPNPLMWRNFTNKPLTQNVIIWENSSGVQNTHIKLQFICHGALNATSDGFYESSGFSTYNATGRHIKHSLTIPRRDWTIDTAINVELAYTRGAATTAGENVIQAASSWLETTTGVTLFPYSLGGRSLENGFLRDSVFPRTHWTSYLPLLGDERILWVDLGANRPGLLTSAAFADSLDTLISLYRAGTPSGKVLFTSDYQGATDTSGISSYYAKAMKTVSERTEGVLFLNTQLLLPDYATGNTLGYYGDAVHYNAVGDSVFAKAMDSLIVIANKTVYGGCE